MTFPDFGWAATDGASREEALAEAKDLLRELIATTIREGKDLPAPRPLSSPIYSARRDDVMADMA